MTFGLLSLAAQALLGDWLSSKLWLEMEMEDEDDLMYYPKRRSLTALPSSQPTSLNYDNFDGNQSRPV